jgi:excisionase family DNA binding protein
MMSAAQLTPWLTKKEAAAYAHVSVDTIERWMRSGRLEFRRPSKTITRIRPEWVDEALAQQADA